MTRADRVGSLEEAKAGVKKCWDEWKAWARKRRLECSAPPQRDAAAELGVSIVAASGDLLGKAAAPACLIRMFFDKIEWMSIPYHPGSRMAYATERSETYTPLIASSELSTPPIAITATKAIELKMAKHKGAMCQ
jgi:hypothetical protein